MLIGRPFVAQLSKQPQVRLRLERPICVSRAVRDVLVREGVPVEHAQVIYGGTRPHEFDLALADREERNDGPLRLLYAGRLTTTKGVHTAIRAVSLLAQRGECHVSLDIVGRGEPGYENYLRVLTRECQLESRVSFRGGVDRTEMPAVLGAHDTLVLLSEWEEPFARIVLEAMAAGLVVVGTTTGGTGEVLVEGETGLTFARGDAEGLADKLQLLIRNPELRRKLARSARHRVEEEFTFTRMVDEIEGVLQGMLVHATS